ncbi:MAG TPA: DUF1761 domain-containing protein [Chlamydiales bacterium]|nr:DUF1761 domain-containing protein [Chlamydiales bacterium]
MEGIQIDVITIVIAAVLNMVIGYLWYSKWLFGPAWAKLEHGNKGCNKKLALLYGFINSLVIAYFLGFFEMYMGVTSVTDGMFVGFCAWLGFTATTQISPVIWSDFPFKGFLLHTGCKLLSFLVMSGVIGA